MHSVSIIGPIAALAAVGIVLVLRSRTLATALVALGFGSAALSHITSALVGYFSFSPCDFVASAQRSAELLHVRYWGAILGLWCGSLVLLWHTLLPSSRS